MPFGSGTQYQSDFWQALATWSKFLKKNILNENVINRSKANYRWRHGSRGSSNMPLTGKAAGRWRRVELGHADHEAPEDNCLPVVQYQVEFSVDRRARRVLHILQEKLENGKEDW